MSPSPEGSIRLGLVWDGAAIVAARVLDGRPLAAVRVLAGRSPEQAAAAIPLLYSICGRAQATAARAALAGAGVLRAPGPEAGRRVVFEAIHEYLWRIALDWPVLAGESARPAPFAALRAKLLQAPAAGGAALAGEIEAYLACEVFGTSAQSWPGAPDAAALRAWAAHGATAAARLLARVWNAGCGQPPPALPPAPARELADAFASALRTGDTFCHAPLWRGAPAETGALARVGGLALIQAARAAGMGTVALRLVARLVELAQLAQTLARDNCGADWVRACAPGEGEGFAAVETARGTLVHHVALAGDGSVAWYRILAPTEWNFHPQGAFAAGLAGAPAPTREAAEHAARLMVQALDPCVAYTLEFCDA